MKRTFTLVAFALLLLLTWAYPGPAGAAASVEPPKAIETPAPEAPEGAPGETAVVLDLVVGEAGAVLSSVVVEGDAPFAEIARTATLAWKFAPATRDGEAVSAKVRVRVELRRRARIPGAGPVDAGGDAPPAAQNGHGGPRLGVADPARDAAVHAVPEATEDVIVRGTRPLAPHVQMLASEVREIPGAFGDAFRAIEAMPGVVPIISGLPYFIIRGAPPGNTGYLLDGIPIPILFHFGIGEAVIHPGLVESVDLFAGAYPARYGRFAGGILSGDTVPPAAKFRGEASIRLLDSGALVELPFANGKGDVLVSGRYGYPGLMLSLIEPLVSAVSRVGLQYWDYQGRIGYRFDDGSRLSLFTFGSYDSITSNNGVAGPMQEVVGIQFERGTLKYTRPTSQAGEVRIEATVGRDRTSTGTTGIVLNSQTYSLLSDWNFHPSENVRMRVGADVLFEPYEFEFPGGQSSAPSGGGFFAVLPAHQNDFTTGLFAELEAKLSRRLTAEFGARVDLFTATYPGQTTPDPTRQSRAVPAFDPRLTVKYAITPDISWITGLGVAHQASNIPLPIPALNFSQLGRGLQTAYQISEGVDVRLPWELSLTSTVYANEFAGLAQLTNNCPDVYAVSDGSGSFGGVGSNGGPGGGPPPVPTTSTTPSSSAVACDLMTVHGRAYGLEFLLRRPLTRRLSGWISYTLSRSEREYFDGSTWTWHYGVSEFDRTHVVNLILAYDLGRNWRAGGRLLAYTGFPYSTTSYDAYPNARMPTFYRLDVRLEKRWPKSWGHVSFIVEWLNVLMQREFIGTNCVPNTTAGNGPPPGEGFQFGTTCSPNQLPAPITIPSIGVEAGF